MLLMIVIFGKFGSFFLGGGGGERGARRLGGGDGAPRMFNIYAIIYSYFQAGRFIFGYAQHRITTNYF